MQNMESVTLKTLYLKVFISMGEPYEEFLCDKN